MSHVEVPQGGTETHRVYIKQGGELVDPDNNSVVPNIITPTSGSNPPSVPTSATRVSKGVYDTDITGKNNTTLSSSLSSGEDWKIKYDFTINGNSPNEDSRTFTFEVVNVATMSESNTFSSVSDVRRNLLDRHETITNVTGSILKLARKDAVDIMVLKKNGTDLKKVTGTPATGEYRFVPPYKIELGDLAQSSDIFKVHIAIYKEDDEIRKTMEEVYNIIMGDLSDYYDLDSLTNTPPLLAKIERWMSQYILLQELKGSVNFRVSEEELAVYEKRWNDARGYKKGLEKGSMTLRDATGTKVAYRSVQSERDVYLDIGSSASE